MVSCLCLKICAHASINKEILSKADLSIDGLFTFIDDARYVDYFFNQVAVMYLELAVECCEKNENEKAIKYINKSTEILYVFNLQKLRR